MKTLLFLVTAIALVISCKGPKSTLDYHNEDFKVSLNKPDNWEISSDSINGILHIISPLADEDDFQEMINIVKGKTNELSLNEFFQRNMSAVQNGFDELNETESPSTVTINGREFMKVKYNYVFQGYPLTADLYVTLTSTSSYIINCSALQNTYDNYQKDFEAVINSIKIED